MLTLCRFDEKTTRLCGLNVNIGALTLSAVGNILSQCGLKIHKGIAPLFVVDKCLIKVSMWELLLVLTYKIHAIPHLSISE